MSTDNRSNDGHEFQRDDARPHLDGWAQRALDAKQSFGFARAGDAPLVVTKLNKLLSLCEDVAAVSSECNDSYDFTQALATAADVLGPLNTVLKNPNMIASPLSLVVLQEAVDAAKKSCLGCIDGMTSGDLDVKEYDKEAANISNVPSSTELRDMLHELQDFFYEITPKIEALNEQYNASTVPLRS